MRAISLAVTGVTLAVIACSSGGTSIQPVERTAVASIELSVPSSPLVVGQTERGTATPLDESGNALVGRPVSWKSSTAAVATVDATGLIAGVSPGNATITATSEGVSNQAGLTVTAVPPAPVATVSVSLAASTLTPGQTTPASATIRDSNNNVLSGRSIAWTSSNTGVATVNASGVVSAVAVGSAQIIGTSEGQSGGATLSVTDTPPVPVASVSVTLANSSRTAGQTTQATATTRDASNNVLTGRSVAWSSSNTAVATVSASGLVTAVAVGSADIIATSESKTGSATLTVAAPSPEPVASVSVTLAASSRTPGQTTQATATTRDANNNVLTGRAITWSSSNPGVATVSSSGLVTAIAVGSVQIIAACEGKSGAATLTVNNPTPVPVASVSVTLANSSLTPGLTTQATATTRDANNNVLTGRSIAWSSSNNALATVSPSGLVTAVAVGSVQITATSEGKTGSANLSVVSPPPPGSSNEPAGMTKVTATREFNAIGEDGEWQDEDPCIIADDPTAPSPTKVFRAEYKTGFVAGSAACDSWLFVPNNYHTVYLSYWFKYSTNWYGQSTGTNKQLYVWTNGDHPTMYLFARGDGNGELEPYATVQGSKVPRSDELLLGPNLVPSARIIRGQWHHFELVLVGNTPGTANGSLDLYLDGVHVSSYSGMQFITGDALWGDVNYAPVWGGLGGSVPQTQTFDIDHFYMSGKQ